MGGWVMIKRILNTIITIIITAHGTLNVRHMRKHLRTLLLFSNYWAE